MTIVLRRANAAHSPPRSRMLGACELSRRISPGQPRKRRVDRAVCSVFGVAGGAGANGEFSLRLREKVEVPRLPLEASAGPGSASGAGGAAEIPFDAFRFSRRWLREQGLEPALLSSIRVMGDSMDPLLRDGDEILVDRTPRPFREGVHVVRLGEALTSGCPAVPPGGLLYQQERGYELHVAMEMWMWGTRGVKVGRL